MATIRHPRLTGIANDPSRPGLLGGSDWDADHTVDLVDADIPASIARDSEVTSSIGSHSTLPNAHHNQSHNHSAAADGSALVPRTLTLPGGAKVSTGEAFPAVPAVNDLCFRTDLGLVFYWNGTRWLSAQVYETVLPAVINQSATAGDLARTPTPSLRGGTDIWLVQANLSGFYVAGGTALSASHNWLVRLDVIAPGGTLNDRASFVVNSGASDTWRQGTPGPVAAINVLLGVQSHFSMAAVKTGTPGNLSANLSVTYRIVAT